MLEGECVFGKSRDMAKMIMGQIDCLVAWGGSVAGARLKGMTLAEAMAHPAETILRWSRLFTRSSIESFQGQILKLNAVGFV